MTGTIDKLLMAYNFEVSTQYGRFRASKVRDIQQSVELEQIREGGVNDYVHSLVTPVTNSKKLVFERGYCDEDINLQMDKLLGILQADPVTLCIFDRAHQSITKSYCVTGWMITKWQVSDWDAKENGVLLETVEMTYERLKGVD